MLSICIYITNWKKRFLIMLIYILQKQYITPAHKGNQNSKKTIVFKKCQQHSVLRDG